MRRKLVLVLAAAMAASALTAVSVSAADASYPEVKLVINGKEAVSDQPAIIVGDRTMVPIRVIGETLGVNFDWDANTKTVIFAKDGLTATLKIGETVLNVTEGDVTVPVHIDKPAIIVGERTLVPIRFISETFGAEVDWDKDTRTVTVTYGKTDEAAEATTEEVEETTEGQYEGMAVRELSDSADLAESYVKQLLDVKMTKSQEKTFEEICDTLATIQSYLDSGKATASEIEASIDSIDDVIDGLKDLADELNVKLIDASENIVELSKNADLADNYVKQLQDVKMTKSQEKTFEEVCDTLATIQSYLDSGKATDSEIKASIDSIDDVIDGLKDLADELDVKLFDDEDDAAKTTNKKDEKKSDITKDEVRDLINKAEDLRDVINDAIDDGEVSLSSDEQNDFDKYNNSVQTISGFFSTVREKDTEELESNKKDLEKAIKFYKNIAEDNALYY